MGNTTDLTLLRKRSMASIISDAYRLYMDNFKKLFRASWPLAIIYAAVFALTTNLFIRDVLTAVTTISDWSMVDWSAFLSHCWMAVCHCSPASGLYCFLGLSLSQADRSHRAFSPLVGCVAFTMVSEDARQEHQVVFQARFPLLGNVLCHMAHYDVHHYCHHTLL